MQTHHQELLEAILQVIKTRYAEDVSILLLYGSYVNGTANEKSDLDMIFIPKTERGWKLAKTFRFQDCGYDLWGASWERLEAFACYEDMKVSIIADARLIFYAAQDDLQCYESLKNHVLSLKNGTLTADFIAKAENHLSKAKQYFGELCLTDNLTCAGGILYAISDVICLLNHTYLRFGIKRMLDEISTFERLPTGFTTAFNQVAHTSGAEQAKTACRTLIGIVSDFLVQLKREIVPPTPFTDLTGLYEEISNHWDKIHRSCEEDNPAVALLAAASLQSELDGVQNRLDLSIDELRFMHAFDAQDLSKLAAAASKAHQAFLALLESNGVPIVQLDSISALKAFLTE